MNLSCSLQFVQLKFDIVLLVTIVQHPRIQFVSCSKQPYPTHANETNDYVIFWFGFPLINSGYAKEISELLTIYQLIQLPGITHCTKNVSISRDITNKMYLEKANTCS